MQPGVLLRGALPDHLKEDRGLVGSPWNELIECLLQCFGHAVTS